MKHAIFFLAVTVLVVLINNKFVDAENVRQQDLLNQTVYKECSLKKVPAQYHSSLKFYSAAYNIPLHVLANMGMKESEWNPDAVGYNRHDGSYDIGLFQLNSKNHAWFQSKYCQKRGINFNPRNPKHNMYVGASYLADLIEQFDGSIYLALCAYNWGSGNVSSGKEIPKCVDAYARQIMKFKYAENKA